MSSLYQIIILVQLFAVVTSDCYDGWLKFDNKCYLFSREKTPWIQASNFCKGEGGYLVEPRSDAEHHFLIDHIFQSDEHTASYWIGGSDIFREDSWIWMSDHTPISKPFWNPGEPNNFHQVLQECILMNFNANEHWVDMECSKAEYFICQRDLGGKPTWTPVLTGT